jgi:hypothetical protein
MPLSRRIIVLFRLVVVVALGLSLGSCSTGFQNLVAGTVGRDDAACCVSLASGIGQSLQVHTTGHFLLLTSADSASADQTARFLDQVYDRFYESFGQGGFAPRASGEKLVCVCFNSYAQMDAYARVADKVDASWMDGYYSYSTNRIAVVRSGSGTQKRAAAPVASSARKAATYRASASVPSDGAGLNLRTVTHEMAHQLAFNSGLQNRNVTYPFWLTEGLATNFEADNSGSFGLGSSNSRYRPMVAATKSRGKLLPLEQFVALTEVSGAGGQSVYDTYAQAWGLFHFLYQNHRQALVEYMSGGALGWPGSQSRELHVRRFTKAFGSIAALEKDFLRSIDQ